jgi:isoleucyl-tRNA synthetase
MPLKELVIFHPSQEYLDDVKSLEAYVAAELNVVTVTYTSDESLVGIKYSADADRPTLGKKLRKDLGKVISGLPKLGSDECKAFLESGKIEVNGVPLVEGDLSINRSVNLPAGGADAPHLNAEAFSSDTDSDVIILLDVRRHAELEMLALLRSLTARVNKLRKEAGLKPTDKVDVLYAYDEGVEGDAVAQAIRGNEEYLEKAIGGVPMRQGSENAPEARVIGTEKRAKGTEQLDVEERFVLELRERA